MRNFLKYLSILMFLITMSLGCSLACYGNGLVCEKNKNLDCLERNFDKLYRFHPQLWAEILHKAEEKATSCKSVSSTARFLMLIRMHSINSEFNEYFAEVSEKLFLTNTPCYLKALSYLNKKDIASIIYTLKHPTFDENEEIRNAFLQEREKRNSKYRKIIEQYFQEEP